MHDTEGKLTLINHRSMCTRNILKKSQHDNNIYIDFFFIYPTIPPSKLLTKLFFIIIHHVNSGLSIPNSHLFFFPFTNLVQNSGPLNSLNGLSFRLVFFLFANPHLLFTSPFIIHTRDWGLLDFNSYLIFLLFVDLCLEFDTPNSISK